MNKKWLSCMMAVAMVSTLATVTAYADDTPIRGTIYFDSTNLPGATSDGSKPLYCYAWSSTDGALYEWMSSATKMTNIGEHLYSYDLPAVNSEGVSVDVDLMMFYAHGANARSWDVTFDDSCIGDTAYIYDTCYTPTYWDMPLCKWRNSTSTGPHITIEHSGVIMGYSLLDGETPEEKVDMFIEDYKFGMLAGYAGYDNPEMVTEAKRAELIAEINRIIDEHRVEEPSEVPTEAPTEAPTTEATEAPTETPTAEATVAPTVAPTAKPTTPATQVPTNATIATSTNTSNGTVNTSQGSALAVLTSTLLASFGVVYGIGKKREKNR